MIATDCVHHWLIDTAKGAYSQGFCVKCGRVALFANTPPEYDWQQIVNPLIKARIAANYRLLPEEIGL